MAMPISTQLKNGQSLVMVLIAGALIAIIGLGVSRLITGGLKGQKTVQANYEITNIKEDIRQILSDPLACKNTFENLIPWPASNAPIAVSAIKTKLNAARFNVGQKYGDNSVVLQSAKLGAFSQDPASALEGFATLSLEFKKVGESFGSSTIVKTLDLNVSLLSAIDPKITACSISDAGGGGAGAEKKWVLAAVDDMVVGNQCYETTGSCDGTYYVQTSTHLLYNCLAMTGTTYVTRFTSLAPCGPSSAFAAEGIVATVHNSGGNYYTSETGIKAVGSSITVKVCCKKPPTL